MDSFVRNPTTQFWWRPLTSPWAQLSHCGFHTTRQATKHAFQMLANAMKTSDGKTFHLAPCQPSTPAALRAGRPGSSKAALQRRASSELIQHPTPSPSTLLRFFFVFCFLLVFVLWFEVSVSLRVGGVWLSCVKFFKVPANHAVTLFYHVSYERRLRHHLFPLLWVHRRRDELANAKLMYAV